MAPAEARTTRRRRAGFSLLEAMAAVAILGLLVPVLAEDVFRALRAEGDVVRRTEASLLADTLLNQLEVQAAGGSAPLGARESEQDLFTIRQEVRVFDPERDGLAAWLQALAPESRPGEAPRFELLQAGEAGPLRLARIEVRWMDGTAEQQVTRTTLLLDRVALEPLVAGLQQSQTTRSAGSGGGGGAGAGAQAGDQLPAGGGGAPGGGAGGPVDFNPRIP